MRTKFQVCVSVICNSREVMLLSLILSTQNSSFDKNFV